jgi:hypothetical protein
MYTQKDVCMDKMMYVQTTVCTYRQKDVDIDKRMYGWTEGRTYRMDVHM